MSLIRLQDVNVGFEKSQILREVFFRLEPKDRVGLIGKNGSGKSTLLKLILQQLEPDSGTVSVDDGLKIGYFSQFSELAGDSTVTEVLDGLFTEIKDVEAELASIDEALGADPDEKTMDKLIRRQSELFEAMDHLDGWDYPRRIDAALTTLGFSEAAPHLPNRRAVRRLAEPRGAGKDPAAGPGRAAPG